ncbi:Aig2 family protein [Favolaschia claudopus]|uniref:gamma-glutamylcyclotransferase n=1 Tax=Favolaschia claudopus TaxID=2862362 RepID=A0AAW0CDY4_9AGAR
MSGDSKSLYFGYGSNLWKHQMNTRCPENQFLGIARLPDWRWIINTRGYANVIPSEGDEVWALLYELSEADEMKLDRYEGVPVSYVKQTLPVEYLKKSDGGDVERQTVDALVYVDIKSTLTGPPRTEYIFRMNSAIDDALAEGVPKAYIDQYLRPRIPVDGPPPDNAKERVRTTIESAIDKLNSISPETQSSV